MRRSARQANTQDENGDGIIISFLYRSEKNTGMGKKERAKLLKAEHQMRPRLSDPASPILRGLRRECA